MKKGWFIMLFTLAVLGCSQPQQKAEKPLDPANMDLTVKPGDDFYRYANGTWLKNNPIPPEYSRWGSFEHLVEKNYKDLRSIFEEAAANTNAPKGSKIQKIGDFFATGMDTAKIESEGIEPIRPYLRKIDEIRDVKSLQNTITEFQKTGMGMLFHLFAEQDKKNSEMNIAWLYQGGLGLPDRDYYLEKDKRSQEIREKYVAHVQKMFELMGEQPEQAAKIAQKIMNFETRLAKASMTRLEQRNPQATYNPVSVKDLARKVRGWNWKIYFKTVGLEDPGTINLAQPEFFKNIGKMLVDESLDSWKLYLKWHLIHNTAEYLSSDFEKENFAFYGTVLSGQQKMKPRWKRVLQETSRSLGELVGQIYVEKFFPPEAKEKALALVMNLKDAFRERIKQLEWMSPVTKQRALAKLEAFNVKIGYPDKWIDYSALEIKRDAYVLNAMRAAAFEFQRSINKIGKPVDRTEWGMTPQTVNAYYHPFMNEIVFPAAILQPPFFNPNADDAVNYGAMGVVIGHEMTHGFDDQGRQFDENGNMNDWWTEEDAKRFKEEADKLVEQFNSFVVEDSFHVDGKLTLGENIADLGGLNIAYDALQKALKQNPQPEKIDGFTPEQRFFLSYAQVWRNNIRRENLLLRLKTDVHSPGEFRTNGPLMNMPQFYKAFGVKEGDKMYRPEADRIKIW
ncbi:MAG: M13 family metallopeptidase [Calditrichia bacterium]